MKNTVCVNTNIPLTDHFVTRVHLLCNESIDSANHTAAAKCIQAKLLKFKVKLGRFGCKVTLNMVVGDRQAD